MQSRKIWFRRSFLKTDLVSLCYRSRCAEYGLIWDDSKAVAGQPPRSERKHPRLRQCFAISLSVKFGELERRLYQWWHTAVRTACQAECNCNQSDESVNRGSPGTLVRYSPKTQKNRASRGELILWCVEDKYWRSRSCQCFGDAAFPLPEPQVRKWAPAPKIRWNRGISADFCIFSVNPIFAPSSDPFSDRRCWTYWTILGTMGGLLWKTTQLIRRISGPKWSAARITISPQPSVNHHRVSSSLSLQIHKLKCL